MVNNNHLDIPKLEVPHITNADELRPAALIYEKNGYYTAYPPGTTAYKRFWDEELKRCIFGYTTESGIYISGYNYFYLNYARIIRTEERWVTYKNNKKKKVISRVEGFPRVYDYDIAYFNAIDKAEEVGKHLVVIKKRGSGYEQPYSEPVMTPQGERPIGELKIGDDVMNPMGYSTKIIDITEEGYKEVYQVEFQDGRKVKTGSNHLWSLYNRKNKLVIHTTEELYKLKLKTGKPGKAKYSYHIPGINEVEFGKNDLPIHPYVFGVLLGDGDISRSSVMFSSNDIELVETVKNLLSDYTIKKAASCPFKYVIKSKKNGFNAINRALKELGIKQKSCNKFIPNIYKYSSVEDRYELVRGLLDTDGSITNGSIRFSSCSKQLAKDLAYVLRSLGIRVRISDKIIHTKKTKFPGEHYSLSKPTWVLVITTGKDIFKLSRKRNKIKKDSYYDRSKIGVKKVTKLGYYEHQRCIVVDNVNSLYLTTDFVPTHNSYKGSAMMCRNFYCLPNSRSIAVAAESEYLTKDGLLSKAWDMMSFIDNNTAFAKKRQKFDTKTHKRASFIREDAIYGVKSEVGWGSEIMAVTLKNDVQKIRGKRAKLILFEEAGNFPGLKAAWQIARPSVEDNNIAFGLLLAYGTGGCLTENNKVYTADGKVISIKDIRQTDGIISYDGEDKLIENIEWIKPYSKKECVRINTSGNNYIECSIDHPILITRPHWRKTKKINGKQIYQGKFCTFKRADEIEVGDQILSVSKIDVFGKKQVKDAYLYGLMIGDGNMSNGKVPTLAVGDEEIYNYIVNNYKYKEYKKFLTKDGRWYRQLSLAHNGNIFNDSTMYGLVKENKRLPLDIHEYNKNSLANLIAGYYDADGSIKYDKKTNSIRITLTSKYESLLDEVKYQLYKFGIYGKVVKEYRKSGYKPGVIYRLYITSYNSIVSFHNNIHLLCSHKTNVISKNLDKLSGIDRTFVKRAYIRIGDDKKGLFYKDKTLKNLVQHSVSSIKSVGVQTVYNLTTPITHSYLAGTYIVGNTEGSSYEGLKDLFYEPYAYNALAINNEWDEGADGTACGFFVPQYYNMEGADREGLIKKDAKFMDKNGNSDIELAIKYETEKRLQIVNNVTDKHSIDRYLAEKPFTPREATLVLSGNIFPKQTLIEHLNHIRNSEKLKSFKQVGELYIATNGEIKWHIDATYKDLTKYRLSPGDDKTGAIVIWEHPIDDPPPFLYIIGVDPYDFDSSTTKSLGSCFVYKRFQDFESYYDLPVAEYTGRPETADEFYERVRLLALYYNATVMYENEKKGLFDYFKRMNSEYLLADQPDIIRDIIADSKVSRIKGIHMNKYIKEWMIGSMNEWLREEYAPGHMNLEKIFSEPLLEELIAYNDDGNFDRVMAFGQCIIYMKELHSVTIKNRQDESKKNFLMGPLFKSTSKHNPFKSGNRIFNL